MGEILDITERNTNLDALYPNGIPIEEISIKISDIYDYVARKSSWATKADPFFSNSTETQKIFSELNGDNDRIAKDILEKGAREILPVFSAYQRLMIPLNQTLASDLGSDLGGDCSDIFEFDANGFIVYRWQNMDSRLYSKYDYTSRTYDSIQIDPNNFRSIEKYLKDALVDYMLKELYLLIGHDKKYMVHLKSYESNRSYVAYWVKKDISTKTQHLYAGV